MSNQSSKRNRKSKDSELVNKNNSPETESIEGRFVAMRRGFQGPLPHPEILERYEKIHPGTAERVLAQFERETQHRQRSS